ncbi:MAG: MnhB domain-containing protein [Nocardioidaceae bacterium]
MSGPGSPARELHDDQLRHRPLVGLALSAVVAALLVVAVLGLPREDAPLPQVARRAMTLALPYWKTTEPVSEVVYGVRAMDTFGETFLLLAAVVGVVLLTRQRERRQGFMGEERAGREERREDDPDEAPDAQEQAARHAEAEESGDSGEASEGRRAPLRPALQKPDSERVGTPAPEQAREMSVVVRAAVRIVSPPLAVAGLYLVVQGYSPGGGFPAGGVALGVVLLLYAAFGYRRISSAVRPSRLELIELVGALAIIAVEVLGLLLAGSFTANWAPLAPQQTLRSGGVMQLFSLSEFIEVGTGLTIAVFALMAMAHDWADDEHDPVGDEQ